MIAGFLFGVVLEVIADVQKSVWVKGGRVGGFCQTGVWGLSRHPNYAGEILQWWCAWGFSYSSSQGYTDMLWWACSLSPVFTCHILLNLPPTGICQAEGKGLKRYYENEKYAKSYTLYRENTSVLVPMLGYKYVPLFLKRTLFLDFKKYEYRPRGK
jgi:steroid 5-alpha reductase family enzyme